MVCHNPSSQTNPPSGLAVSDCSTGDTGKTEGICVSREPQLPLPTFEDYFPPPFELDSSSESLTETIERVLSQSRRDLSSLSRDQVQTVLDYEEEQGLGVGACLNHFSSGEITGGCYSKGNKRAPGRKGKLLSKEFTKQARKKLRRAAESRAALFKIFITFTFDPKLSKRDENGCVNQEWAKEEFSRLLNTLKKKYDRMAEKTGKESWRLSYIWVAEVQQNGNIHFHVLVDREFIPVAWLVKIWGQANNSVNVKRLNNQEHAVNYMLKYMKKGNSPIEGRRYGMTQNLVNASKPVKYDFYGRAKRNAFLKIKEELEWRIKQNGGYVGDWGFSLPSPRRNRFWRDKYGNTHQSKGTSRKIGQDFLEKVSNAMFELDEAICYDKNTGSIVELPF